MSLAIAVTNAATWPEARELLRTTPMSAKLPLAVERIGDEAGAYPSLGGEHRGLVAHEGGQIVGYLHFRVETRRIWRDGALASEPLLYSGDLRVHPAARRRGVAQALLNALPDVAREAGATRGIGFVNEGNEPILTFIRRGADRIRGDVVRTFTTATRLLLRRPTVRASRVQEVAPDLAMLRVLAEASAERLLAPVAPVEAWARLVAENPEIRWFARDGALLFGLWDQHRFRRLRVVSLPPALTCILHAWRLGARFTGAARPPRAGGAWRMADVTADVGADDESIDVASRAAFDAGCHMINVIESGLGSSARAVPGMVQRMRSHVVVYGIDGAAPPVVPASAKVHIDLGFL